MVVNHEMDALEEMLIQCGEVLNEGGVLSVISYHSIEDRLVKNYMKSGNLTGTVEKDFFGVEHTPFARVTRKPLSPSDEEIEDNPRARSAKLRVVKKK
jgi:16S rRNA (cytosine1402-N4)-methyltransferase